MHINKDISIYISIYIYMPIYIYTYSYMYLYIHKFIYTCKHTYIYTYAYAYIHSYNRYASFVVLFLFLFLSCFFFVVLFRKSALCFVRLNYNRVLQMHRASVVHQDSLQHRVTATHEPLVESILSASIRLRNSAASFMFVKSNARQHTATHCNTLQHTATHCNTHERLIVSILPISVQFMYMKKPAQSKVIHVSYSAVLDSTL